MGVCVGGVGAIWRSSAGKGEAACAHTVAGLQRQQPCHLIRLPALSWDFAVESDQGMAQVAAQLAQAPEHNSRPCLAWSGTHALQGQVPQWMGPPIVE